MHPRSIFALLSLLALVSTNAATVAQKDDAPEIVDRAAQYVAAFVSRFSNVVAEEVYVQERTEGAAVTHGTRVRRELTSDFLFVRTSDSADWLVFRDVRLVNGREVRNRESRLLKLLTAPANEARAFAEVLAAENARHGLSNWPGINNPLIALSLLQDEYRYRLAFSLESSTSDGDWVILRFREHVRPTLLRAGRSEIILDGRFWITRETGRISQTELAIGRNAAVTTTFAYDEQLETDVPVEMRERYSTIYATGQANYSDFRTFQIQTDEVLEDTSIP